MSRMPHTFLHTIAFIVLPPPFPPLWQIWDPETGYCLHQFSSPRNSQFVAMTTLPSPQPIAVVATADLHLRFIDLRVKVLQHLWKLQFPTGGTVRALACSDNWVAVGNYSGQINTFDVRTGEVLSSWKPAEVFSQQVYTTFKLSITWLSHDHLDHMTVT